MNRRIRLLAAVVLVAGALHLIHAEAHQADPLLFWFFAGSGLTQVLLAGLVWREKPGAQWAALIVNGGLIGIYLAGRVALPNAEPIEAIAIATKTLEAAAIVLAIGLVRPAPTQETTVDSGLAVSRRHLLKAGSVAAASIASGGVFSRLAVAQQEPHSGVTHTAEELKQHFRNVAVGSIDTRIFDPMKYLRDFEYGVVSKDPDGRTVRDYRIVATDVEIEVAPGVFFPAWAYNGKVPGPTIRATEGDRVRIKFTNAGSHPHTMHFHGFHRAGMDGVFEIVEKGQSFTYDFIAEPFGLHHYHCHVTPLKRHIHKGLYGVFIVDPPGGRPPADEMVMVMNAFDTNLDGENEVYAVNTVAHYYMHNPVVTKQGELMRIYLVNITEFDLLNSFHPHATFFHEYRTGTKLEPDNFTDTIILGQGERSILELTYKDPGDYMFHAHISEFAELGWMGLFRVVP